MLHGVAQRAHALLFRPTAIRVSPRPQDRLRAMDAARLHRKLQGRLLPKGHVDDRFRAPRQQNLPDQAVVAHDDGMVQGGPPLLRPRLDQHAGVHIAALKEQLESRQGAPGGRVQEGLDSGMNLFSLNDG